VVGILRELGTSRVLPILTEALAEEATAPQGRRGAALCLAQFGSDGIPVLVRSLGHTNAEVRRQARDALFTTGRACLDPVLREVERHNGRAPEAVAVLVRLRNDAVPGLERLMMSGTLEQCRAAATALAKIGTVEARRVLEAGAQEAYDSDRRKVIQKVLERQRKTGR
jgi:HEAT repeat protein